MQLFTVEKCVNSVFCFVFKVSIGERARSVKLLIRMIINQATTNKSKLRQKTRKKKQNSFEISAKNYELKSCDCVCGKSVESLFVQFFFVCYFWRVRASTLCYI